MINIVRRFNAIVDLDHAPQKTNDIVLRHGAMRNGNVEIKLLIQLITPDALEIVMALVEQLLFEKLFGVLQRSRIAGAHFAEELNQRGFSDGLLVTNFPLRFLPKR